MKQIVFFGTGDRGKRLFTLFYHYGIEIQYWIDSDPEKWNTKLEGKRIYSPSEIQNGKDIYVYISALDPEKEMYNTLLGYGLTKHRIGTFSEAVIDCMSSHFMWKSVNRISKKADVILDCSNGLGLGGVEAWCIGLMRGLREKGHEAYLLSACGEYDVGDETRKNTLWVDSEKSFCWENLEHMLEVLQSQAPCILIINSVNDLLMAACSLKKRYPEHIKIIAVVHLGTMAVYKDYSESDLYIEKYVAVSKDIQRGMVNCGIAEEKVLHMTCPVECAEPYERNYSLDYKKPVKIGYAGRIEQAQKRLDCLGKILMELEKLGTNYHMEIAGEGGYLSELSEEIKDCGLECKVKLTGRIDRKKIPGFWAKQDICINLSEFEGRSISIMEAMKNGAVPVVTDTSGVREDIEDGKNGYIVNDYNGIAEKIDYLSKNRKLLVSFGELSHEWMAKKNSMEVHIKFWENLLDGPK